MSKERLYTNDLSLAMFTKLFLATMAFLQTSVNSSSPNKLPNSSDSSTWEQLVSYRHLTGNLRTSLISLPKSVNWIYLSSKIFLFKVGWTTGIITVVGHPALIEPGVVGAAECVCLVPAKPPLDPSARSCICLHPHLICSQHRDTGAPSWSPQLWPRSPPGPAGCLTSSARGLKERLSTYRPLCSYIFRFRQRSVKYNLSFNVKLKSSLPRNATVIPF